MSALATRETVRLSQQGKEGRIEGPIHVFSIDVENAVGHFAPVEPCYVIVRRGEAPLLQLVVVPRAVGGCRWEQTMWPLIVEAGDELRWVTDPPTTVLLMVNKPDPSHYEPPIMWDVVDPILKPLLVDETASHRHLPPKANEVSVHEVDTSACPYKAELDDDVMSNFDHRIDAELAECLKTAEAFARYAGWDFNGRVWWARDVERWRCEVWCYCTPVAVVEASSLEDIMSEVCERWGVD